MKARSSSQHGHRRKYLLALSIPTLTLGMMGAVPLPEPLSSLVVPVAMARGENPCAPIQRGENPCAPMRGENPCAPAQRGENPCAPLRRGENPCAPNARGENPCAPARN